MKNAINRRLPEHFCALQLLGNLLKFYSVARLALASIHSVPASTTSYILYAIRQLDCKISSVTTQIPEELALLQQLRIKQGANSQFL